MGGGGVRGYWTAIFVLSQGCIGSVVNTLMVLTVSRNNEFFQSQTFFGEAAKIYGLAIDEVMVENGYSRV